MSDKEQSELKKIKVESLIINKNKRMSLIGNIEPYVIGGSFAAYTDRMKQFFKVNKIQDEEKTSLFITVMGAEMYELLTSLTTPKLPSEHTFEELLSKLSVYFEPKKNKRAERFKFYRTVQQNGESIAYFIVRLKTLSQNCKFGDFLSDAAVATYKTKALDEALVDQFITGLQSEHIQQVLLNDDSNDFEVLFSRLKYRIIKERSQRV